MITPGIDQSNFIFLLAERERLARLIEELGIGIFRVAATRETTDAKLVSAKDFFAQILKIENELEKILNARMSPYPLRGSYLSWIKRDNKKLLTILRGKK